MFASAMTQLQSTNILILTCRVQRSTQTTYLKSLVMQRPGNIIDGPLTDRYYKHLDSNI